MNDEGRFFCYYVARKRGGTLCVAVASAPSPGGPYTDHGPIVCDALGSIDPCFARDEYDAPFLLWKEDGNSVGLPTPIWAQPLAPDMLQLVGDRTMLITNDAAWEDGVVEGPSIIRHAEKFYMFYGGQHVLRAGLQVRRGCGARGPSAGGRGRSFPATRWSGRMTTGAAPGMARRCMVWRDRTTCCITRIRPAA